MGVTVGSPCQATALGPSTGIPRRPAHPRLGHFSAGMSTCTGTRAPGRQVPTSRPTHPSTFPTVTGSRKTSETSPWRRPIPARPRDRPPGVTTCGLFAPPAPGERDAADHQDRASHDQGYRRAVRLQLAAVAGSGPALAQPVDASGRGGDPQAPSPTSAPVARLWPPVALPHPEGEVMRAVAWAAVDLGKAGDSIRPVSRQPPTISRSLTMRPCSSARAGGRVLNDWRPDHVRVGRGPSRVTIAVRVAAPAFMCGDSMTMREGWHGSL